MSDKILKALMQLFAIVANADEVGTRGREVVERFLRRQLSSTYIEHYLAIYDEFLDMLKGKTQEGKVRKRTSVNSVKVLRICTEINKELEQRQKIIVLIRLVEFVYTASHLITDQHLEFIKTVSDIFSISDTDYSNILLLARQGEGHSDPLTNHFLVAHHNAAGMGAAYHIVRENLSGVLIFLSFTDLSLYIFRYIGTDQLLLDGRAIIPISVHIFEPGSVIRGARLSPVYYNDIIHSFQGVDIKEKVTFQVEQMGFKFRNNKIGLHELTFNASSKNLVGIMGNSGAGKTTLLNLLNGSAEPTSGKILINGVDLHTNRSSLLGLIGNIPQDDLLMEELTVFQNLFLSSKLYFGGLSNEEITDKVNKCLISLGLYEIRDLLVGDVMNKYISGGQRKRLNIALELIREPEILFVDEPTSGLSSNDAVNVMDLLKHLALSGKLIFVVIHQPSSEIFKLFDQLLVLDTGGYPIYYGNPVDSIRYFRQQMNYVDFENSECAECGNINPEEIFRIIESKTVDEFGRPTAERKIQLKEWFEHYKLNFVPALAAKNNQEANKPTGAGTLPKVSNPFIQYLVYFQRNLLSKINNSQYIAITLFEAPLLALILSVALRSAAPGVAYSYGANPNIPVYIFICAIVVLFLGLIVSADEIINDKKILKRESFLQLSRNSYLLSKVSFLFIISAVQTLLFLLIGNFILGIHGLFADYWLVLFSVSCFANLLGLNISSGMKTRVAVYIVIPFLIIPQIMLSGVMVKFEDLSPIVSSQSRVPLIGNIMATRWAYEALAVDQFKNNEFEKKYFTSDAHKSNANYRKDWWAARFLSEINKQEQSLQSHTPGGDSTREMERFLKTELGDLHSEYPAIPLVDISPMSLTASYTAMLNACKQNIELAGKYLIAEYNRADATREQQQQQDLARAGSDESYVNYRMQYSNDRLADFVKNSMGADRIIVADHRIVRKFEPVFQRCTSMHPFAAPFYSFSKCFFGMQLETIWFNLIMIWAMSIVLYITLYYDLLCRLLNMKRG